MSLKDIPTNIFIAKLTEHCLKPLSCRDVNFKLIEERSLFINTRKTLGHKRV